MLIFLVVIPGIILKGCGKLDEHDMYRNPDWLAGKLYTQLLAEENLSKFAECLKIVGYDTILDVSGSYTVFAPSDEAMDLFLAEYQYASASDIPRNELLNIVKFHIIQDAWSIIQLQMLNINGWIDPDNPHSEPNAYKRQTLLKNPNEKYWIRKKNGDDFIVMDSTSTSMHKKVFTRSRKYVPIFFDDFLNIYGLSPEDYSFYFGRQYEPGNVYYAEARITQSEIFAENGFIHVVDRVVRPMLNAKEMLERELPGESYKVFLDLIYQHPQFRPNMEETNNQPAARSGLNFDTLFNLSFPGLSFDLHEELTGPSYALPKNTYVYHNGMYVPTDDAFQNFLDEVVTAKSGYPHWPDFQAVPAHIKQMIVKTHFNNTPVYYKSIGEGIRNEEGDRIYLDEAAIIRKEYGSNCTFLGLSKAVTPRAFSSVTGPVYLRPEYSTFMYAMEYTGVLNDLTRDQGEYSFFPIPDIVLENDSSLIMEWIDFEQNQYSFKSLNRSLGELEKMSRNTLKSRILTQVGTTLPTGSANKEFIQSFTGNYIIWNNEVNTVQGARPNTFGYQGRSPIFYHPEPLEEPADNGKTWRVDSWFNNVNASLYDAFVEYPTFMKLLEQAGLYNPKLYSFPFLEEWNSYTIFIPSDQALISFQADTLPKKELADLLKYHFIDGVRIFTDNKRPWSDYETLRKDESSTPFSTYYSTMNIRPGPDIIEILDAEGNPYVSIPEAEMVTNIMAGEYIFISVIHEIDTVLINQ